jgi:hypothetical protein
MTLDLDNYLLPWRLDQDQPQLIELNGVKFLPVFSTYEKLIESRLATQVKFTTKVILDGREFLDSVRGQIRIMIDPWVDTETNKTHWVEPKGEV